MRSWPAPEVPDLPGQGPPLVLHDTATGQRRVAAPGPRAGLYVCGITPYDATHLGHAATYLAFDLVQRVWRDGGLEVVYVQNVTDVDDPLLERARRDGVDWRELADRETTRFRDDMTALQVLPPDHYVGATEAIPRIVQAITGLRARGAAYDLDGDVYFSVSCDPRFGAVAGYSTGEMVALFAERGGDPDRPGKKDPLDPLLWRTPRAGGDAHGADDPGDPAWETELGPGRPGWHIECTAIALEHLGMGFDVQGGGSDLAFPHHEMGASHGQVLTGEWPFARLYAHVGMVGLGGEKMSKSRGNLVFVSALRGAGVDPTAVRLALLDHHYRTDWDWTDDDLHRAEQRRTRWRAAVARRAGPPAEPVLTAVRRHLADDLDAPAALAAVDRWAGDRDGSDPGAPALVARTVQALLGVRP